MVNLLNENTYHINDWFNFVSREFTIKLRDIKELPYGLPLEVLLIDRNFLDLCPTGRNVNIAQNLEKFGRGNYIKTNQDSLKGHFTWYPMEGEGSNSHFDTDWEWHVCEYGTSNYYPLLNDKLNLYCDDHDLMFNRPEEYRMLVEGCKHYSMLDDRSLIGWRGFMIPLDKVHLLPNINTLDY